VPPATPRHSRDLKTACAFTLAATADSRAVFSGVLFDGLLFILGHTGQGRSVPTQIPLTVGPAYWRIGARKCPSWHAHVHGLLSLIQRVRASGAFSTYCSFLLVTFAGL
jgi:hypothetical protein